MSTRDRAPRGNLTVRITDDLVVIAGSWQQTLDQRNRPIAHIEPPNVPMFTQVVEYLEASGSQMRQGRLSRSVFLSVPILQFSPMYHANCLQTSEICSFTITEVFFDNHSL